MSRQGVPCRVITASLGDRHVRLDFLCQTTVATLQNQFACFSYKSIMEGSQHLEVCSSFRLPKKSIFKALYSPMRSLCSLLLLLSEGGSIWTRIQLHMGSFEAHWTAPPQVPLTSSGNDTRGSWEFYFVPVACLITAWRHKILWSGVRRHVLARPFKPADLCSDLLHAPDWKQTTPVGEVAANLVYGTSESHPFVRDVRMLLPGLGARRRHFLQTPGLIRKLFLISPPLLQAV